MSETVAPADFVRSRFAEAGIPLAALEIRSFPGETILVVRVDPELLEKSITLGNLLDRDLAATGFNGFVTIRPAEGLPRRITGAAKQGVLDPRRNSRRRGMVKDRWDQTSLELVSTTSTDWSTNRSRC